MKYYTVTKRAPILIVKADSVDDVMGLCDLGSTLQNNDVATEFVKAKAPYIEVSLPDLMRYIVKTGNSK